MHEPQIRRATLDDAETVSDLGARTFTETFGHLYRPEDLAAFLASAHSLDRARRDLSDPSCAVWLLEDDGVAVGYALAGPCDLPHGEVTPACGELKRIYILKARQRRGMGRRILATALAWLERDGPRNLWIGVWSENRGAQRLYKGLGFEKVGEYDFPVGAALDREFILRRDRA